MRSISSKGMALVTVLLLSVILTLMTVSMVFISTNYLQMTGNIEEKIKALKGAEAAAEYAYNRLNVHGTWGIDPNDNVEIKLDGASGSIKFGKNSDYLSYNNLKSSKPVTRASIGDTKLTGSIPAYTAEIICKGMSGRTIKYVKVIFVRNDVYPYNLNAQGKILCNNGHVNIFGSVANTPGHMHSNWYDPNDSTSYSISGSSIIDAKSGLLTSVGPSSITKSGPTSVTVQDNLGPIGKEDFENIDPAPIINNAKTTSKQVQPGSLTVTPLYYIPPGSEERALNAALGTSAASYASNLGLPDNLSDVNPWAGNPNVTGVSWSPKYSSITYTGVTGSVTNGNIWGGSQGYDTVTASTCTGSVSWTVSGTEHYWEPTYDANGVVTGYEEKTKPITSGGSASKTVNPQDCGIPSSYTLPVEESWGDKGPPSKIGGICKWELGLGRTDSGNNLTRFTPQKSTKSELGMEFEVDKDSEGEYTYSGTIKLTDDLYVSTGSTRPDGNDYQQTLDAIVAARQNNLFRIERGGWNGKTMNITLDLNGHNIYSDAHMVIGAEVHGQGALISRGKLAYVYGIESSDLVSISGDDLLVETSGTRDSYYINGVLYSQDDTIVRPLTYGGALGGNGDGKMKRFSTSPPKVNPDDPEPVKLHNGVLELYFPGEKGDYATVFRDGTAPDYTYTVPSGTKFNYNGIDYTLKGELRITSSGANIYISTKDPDDPEKTIWIKTTPDDPNGIIPSIDQSALNEVSSIISYNYDKSTGDITVAGTVIGLNSHTSKDGDNGGNESIRVIHNDPNATVTFNYVMNGLGKVALLRGDSFHVRRICWVELN